MNEPLLAWSDLRIDQNGLPRFDGAPASGSSVSQGSRVLVLGAPRALFLAIAGELPIARGRLSIGGEAPDVARRNGSLAVVRFDLPMPAEWRARQYVEWSVRLYGIETSRARAAAYRALNEVSVEANAAIGSLDAAARDRVQLATAIASGAKLIALDDPFAGRTDAAAAALEATILTSLADRAWMVFAARAPLSSAVAATATHTMVLAGSELAADGTAASIAALARAYVLRFAPSRADLDGREGEEADATREARAHADFARAAAQRGIAVSTRGDATVVVLPEALGTRALFPLADAADLAIVELRPLAGPLS